MRGCGQTSSARARAEIMLAEEAQPRLAPIHDAVRTRRPGMLDRPGAWWDLCLYDPEREREGAGRLRAAVLGELGYVLYAFKDAWGAEGPDGSLDVRELVAATPAAAAALWGFVLELDLVRRVTWRLAPADEPLAHMLGDARSVSARLVEGLWVRLVDLPRALSARTYSAPFDVVLDVADEACPMERRPAQAQLGRAAGGLRADRGRGRPGAVGRRAGRGLSRRHDARGARPRGPRAGADRGLAAGRERRLPRHRRAVVPREILKRGFDPPSCG